MPALTLKMKHTRGKRVKGLGSGSAFRDSELMLHEIFVSAVIAHGHVIVVCNYLSSERFGLQLYASAQSTEVSELSYCRLSESELDCRL
jgi:hypothetical protein